MSEKLVEMINSENYSYVAVKGSPFANDCAVFGLSADEIAALGRRFPNSGTMVINGTTIKGPPLPVINALAELGYKVVSSTGEAEILWTLQRIEMEGCGHGHDCGSHSSTSLRQNLEEMDFERGLWYAAQHNDMERVDHLLRKGYCVDGEDSAGYTALHYAARHGHVSVCKKLLENRAKVDAVTRSGNATPLHRAATQGFAPVVELLLKYGADPNAQDSDGFTPLHRAVKSNSILVCKLLASKTNQSLLDNRERTAVMLALEIGNEGVVELLSKEAQSKA